jgi:hypothetical protein
MKKGNRPQPKPSQPKPSQQVAQTGAQSGGKMSWLSPCLSIVALIVSILSLLNSRAANRDSFRANLPALSITSMIVNPPIQAGIPIQTFTTFKNYGHTTAKALGKMIRTGYEARLPDLTCTHGPDSFGYPVLPQIKADLGPGDQNHSTDERPYVLSAEIVNKINDGTFFFYLYGCAFYADTNGGAHEQHFCQIYHPSMRQFGFCDVFNDGK